MRRWFVFRYSSRLACFLLKKPWGRQRKSFPGRWAGKESARNAGEPGSIPGNGKFPWRRDRLPTPLFLGFPGGSTGKEKWKWSCSIMSDSLWPHRLQPTRLLHPWDFPGKSTGVGCHFLLQGIFPTQGWNPGLPHCRQMTPGKESAYNVGDLGSTPEFGRSPGEGNSYPLQYSGLKNSMDRGAWQATVHGLQRAGHNWGTFMFIHMLLFPQL